MKLYNSPEFLRTLAADLEDVDPGAAAQLLIAADLIEHYEELICTTT